MQISWKMTKKVALTLVLSALQQVAIAEDGNQWLRRTEVEKFAEITRVFNNMRAKGCTIRYDVAYYVRQLNDFYAEPTTRSTRVPQAFALIATAIGEDFNCSR
jgi:hypothetical protein